MDDKEVGKLWQEACNQGGNNPVHFWRVKDLIRKLVEERCELYGQLWKEGYKDYHPFEQGQELALADALQSFGIDPASWKEEL